MGLFNIKSFKSHSGLNLTWKVDCDYLTDEDLETMAHVYVNYILYPNTFSKLISVPRGGDRFARKLTPYLSKEGLPLIVDDVCTSGSSFNEWKEKYPTAMGVCIFARGQCPSWVKEIWKLNI